MYDVCVCVSDARTHSSIHQSGEGNTKNVHSLHRTIVKLISSSFSFSPAYYFHFIFHSHWREKRRAEHDASHINGQMMAICARRCLKSCVCVCARKERVNFAITQFFFMFVFILCFLAFLHIFRQETMNMAWIQCLQCMYTCCTISIWTWVFGAIGTVRCNDFTRTVETS